MAWVRGNTGCCDSKTLICMFLAFSLPFFTASESIANIPGSAFTENNGFEAATEAAPVWLFGRSWNRNPCYPDTATVNDGNDPNPGTGPAGGPLGADPNPGDCRDPGPWGGIYSPGESFPNYINAIYCSDKDQWYVTYSLYYVHDGALSEGHINDWESATVVWGRQDDGADFWSRQSLILSEHSGHNTYSWNDIQSVDDPTDQDESTGQYKKHPKVYVGFFKHANFPNKKTNINVFDAIAPNDEFRSDDWYFLPQMQDMHASGEIHSDWSYGDATSTPATINPCSF